MVHDTLFSRMDFDGFHPTRTFLLCREDKIPVVVRTSGSKNVGLPRAKDEVGLTKLPAGAERRRRRELFGVTAWRAFIRP